MNRKVDEGMKEYIMELSDNVNAISILVKAYNLHELVRCKDCKYWSNERINDYNKCKNWINVGVKNFATMGDWFCADGQPR